MLMKFLACDKFELYYLDHRNLLQRVYNHRLFPQNITELPPFFFCNIISPSRLAESLGTLCYDILVPSDVGCEYVQVSPRTTQLLCYGKTVYHRYQIIMQ